jgi:very-short-patch-repair endonuclease
MAAQAAAQRRARPRSQHQMEAAGWTVLRAWEHEATDAVVARIVLQLKASASRTSGGRPRGAYRLSR